MNLKSLLFGSAAVLAVGTGAQAADLPSDLPIAEPVDYVRICDAFGAGYYYIPGTDTCLRVYGRVFAEANYVDGDVNTPLGVSSVGVVGDVPLEFLEAIELFETERQVDDPLFVFPFGFAGAYVGEEEEFNNYRTRVRGNVRLDARTQTDFGLVRAFLNLEANIGNANFGINYSGDTVGLNQAFIQITNDWGTYTAGHVDSFFDFFGSGLFNSGGIGIDDPTDSVNLFAWTFGFGNGFSATLSIEDPQSVGRRVNPGFGFVAIEDVAVFEDFGFAGGGFDSYEGQEAPDLVGNIRLDQGWGSFQVMGVIGHIHDEDGFEHSFGFADVDIEDEDETGDDDDGDGDALRWAVGAGLTLNLPFWGLEFNSQAGYAEGAIRYVTADPFSQQQFGNASVGDFIGPEADDSLTEAWSVRANVNGDLWSPGWSFGVSGSYTEVDSDEVTLDTVAFGDVVFGGVDYNHWGVGGQIIWEPVSGLTFGWEGAYQEVELENDQEFVEALCSFTCDDDQFDAYRGTFRVNREF